MLSKSDAAGGGASRVAGDLADGLRACGHEAVHHCTWAAGGFDGALRRSLHPAPIRRGLMAAMHAQRRLGLGELIPFDRIGVLANRLARDFDVVHVHDISGALSPLTVRWLARRVPTVWTIHDCSPVTGGCLYPMGCTRYKTRCGTDGGCPQTAYWPIDGRFDLTGLLQDVKAALHAEGRVTLLTPSAWMADMVADSGKAPMRPTVVSNGIDLGMFRPPPDRPAVRRALGVPDDRQVVLLSATSISSFRKGMGEAIAALQACRDLRPFVVLVGRGRPDLDEVMQGLDHTATGFIDDPRRLAEVYGAADLFLFCSRADNQPLALLETAACGTPAVAWATGGIPEIIAAGTTGLLVPAGDGPATAAALRSALGDPARLAAWGRAARARAEELFGLARAVETHLELYRRLARPGAQHEDVTHHAPQH